jgi:hypothetical protein
MKARPYLLTVFSFLLGAALFLFILKQFDAEDLWARVRKLDARFGWILAVSAVRPVLRAYAWLRSLSEAERGVGMFQLWRARLIGDAIGNLTTAGPLLAEPARLAFFSGRLPLTAAAAALSLELFSYLLSACLLMLAGLLVLLLTVDAPGSLRAASALAALGLTGFLSVVAMLWWRRWSLVEQLRKVGAHLSSVHHFLRRIIQQLDAPLQKLEQLEAHHFDFYRQRPRDFAWVCLCEAGFHLSGVIEIWLTLSLLNVPVSWLTAFLFEALNRLINMAFAFVPVKLGVDEAGTGLLAGALGFGALTGVTLAVYRKLRVLFWTAVGLLLLLAFYVQRRLQPGKRSQAGNS